MLKPLLYRCACPLVLSASALAADYYVDVVTGNDANSGTSPALAWRTITHAAAASAPGLSNVIHLAPGTYGVASGETFPLVFNGQMLHGDAGAGATVIDGNGTSTLIAASQGPGFAYTFWSLEGVTVRNASSFLTITVSFGLAHLGLRDVKLQDIGGTCISLTCSPQPSGASVELFLDHMDFSAAHAVTLISGSVVTGHSSIYANDCIFSNASGDAVTLSSINPSNLNLWSYRCRFTDNAGSCVSTQCFMSGGVAFGGFDSLFARNGAAFRQLGTDASASSSVEFHGSTIVDNTGHGIQNTGLGTSQTTTNIVNTIVQGNGIDVQATNPQVFNSWVSAGDPLFRDRPTGDYRLRFGSPCIDGGVSPPTGIHYDITGLVRPIDGELDTVERADIGAYEFMPLSVVTSGHVGTPLRLEMSGQAGGTTTVYFTRGAPVAPASTPFGQFDLNPATFGTLLTSAVAPFPPVGFQRPIPNSAHLIGMTFSFQGLTSSTLAPQGFAYTNVVTFTVTP